jgi:tetratricopeptide (TPR) repeat protein
VVYLSSLSSMALALMHMGRWGELRQTLQTGMDLSEKNGHEPWHGIFEVMLGWLHIEAFDFEGARRIAESLLKRFTETPIGQVQSMALLTIGRAELTVGDLDRAVDCFIKVRDRQATPKVFLQWYWRMLSQIGLVGAYLRRNDIKMASAAADQFLADALTTADPALRAPAWDAVARVAARKGDHQRALECVTQALASIENLDLPSVAWRVHATAVSVNLQQGIYKAAERHRDLAVAILRNAAASFRDDDRLRQSLMAAADSLQMSLQRELKKTRELPRA